ncbi:hypothetical protein FOMPIDRAFT_92287 [Fomitopsis schrenkii]|uniref:Uncharacterized protein n=1 Tax=Fomitopsis schrenkii TaxID=2126942 RepID=S8F4C6_FOMSC|nr:hypothetical protein FOMPIDRAFT_92287 [Fomitopsis schrenkii]
MGDSSRRATPNTHTASANTSATAKVPTTKQLPLEVSNVLNKMRETSDAATDCLHQWHLIPEDLKVSNNMLMTGLLNFAAMPTTKLAVWAIEVICAFAVYAQDVHADDLTATVWKRLQPVMVIQALGRLEATATQAEETICNHPPPPPPLADAAPTGRPSYAATVMHVLPTLHAASITRQEAQFHKVLIDIKTVDGGTAAAPLSVAEYMHTNNHPPPDGLRFLTVKRLDQGGLLYEVNTKEGTYWLQRPENM